MMHRYKWNNVYARQRAAWMRMYKRLCKGKFSEQGLFARDCEGTEPLQIINEIGVDIYPTGVYYKDS